MLTTILERGSWVVAKVGMPLVLVYHLLLTNVFWNTAADDATGIEWMANQALSPLQYFFEGKRAIPYFDQTGQVRYKLERRYSYSNHFYLKTASSVTLLPLSIATGGILKCVSFLFPETRERNDRIHQAAQETSLFSNRGYYASIGLNPGDLLKAEKIASPKYKTSPQAKHRLAPDLEALKEISRLLKAGGIPFWLDCGSCLGTYQYGGAIPHDWDIDIAVLLPDFENTRNALRALDPERFVVQDWSGRARPKSYLKVFVKESGGMIDLYHFQIDLEKKTVATLLSNEFNIFLPKSWKIREKRYCTPFPFSTVFPLKKGTFEGIEVPVPNDIVKYLQTFYGENLAPAKLYNETTGQYEKDLTHPYWQLPHAH